MQKKKKKKKLFCKGNVWLKLILNKIIKNRLKGFLSNTPVKQKKKTLVKNNKPNKVLNPLTYFLLDPTELTQNFLFDNNPNKKSWFDLKTSQKQNYSQKTD
jgi:hypothetical protein